MNFQCDGPCGLYSVRGSISDCTISPLLAPVKSGISRWSFHQIWFSFEYSMNGFSVAAICRVDDDLVLVRAHISKNNPNRAPNNWLRMRRTMSVRNEKWPVCSNRFGMRAFNIFVLFASHIISVPVGSLIARSSASGTRSGRRAVHICSYDCLTHIKIDCLLLQIFHSTDRRPVRTHSIDEIVYYSEAEVWALHRPVHTLTHAISSRRLWIFFPVRFVNSFSRYFLLRVSTSFWFSLEINVSKAYVKWPPNIMHLEESSTQLNEANDFFYFYYSIPSRNELPHALHVFEWNHF